MEKLLSSLTWRAWCDRLIHHTRVAEYNGHRGFELPLYWIPWRDANFHMSRAEHDGFGPFGMESNRQEKNGEQARVTRHQVRYFAFIFTLLLWSHNMCQLAWSTVQDIYLYIAFFLFFLFLFVGFVNKHTSTSWVLFLCCPLQCSTMQYNTWIVRSLWDMYWLKLWKYLTVYVLPCSASEDMNSY
jgi:hypothetical protein